MDHEQRAKKSIEATNKIKEEVLFLLNHYNVKEGWVNKVLDESLLYIKDAEYFYKKGDFFSSFGASDFAFGLLKALKLYLKAKK